MDKETLKALKQDIFDEEIPISNTIRKYFKTVSELNTTYNIAYRNNTCQSVSNDVRTKLLQKSEPYETREFLICRSWCQVKKASVSCEQLIQLSRK
ncbi:MAG: hypothetical protein ACKPKO_59340 [Candidatus Fonsibacter sp.]